MENRREFFARLEGMSEFDRVMVELAYNTAKHAHRWQRREQVDDCGEPIRYFEHCRQVALYVIEYFGADDWETIAIALLHDIIEDTKYVTDVHLKYWFTPRVAENVRLLTKLPHKGYERRLSSTGEWRALIVKGCDRLHNNRTLSACPPEKRKRKSRETLGPYRPVFERMKLIVPAHLSSKAEQLYDDIMVSAMVN